MKETKNWSFVTLLFFLVAILALSGCYRKGENIPVNPPTASGYITDAWSTFEKGDYEAAEADFQAAKERDALQAEAYLGLGWVEARLLKFDDAISNFRILQSISQDQGMLLDSYAGLAVCYAAMNQHDAAIEEAERVISVAPDYAFSHDDYVNAKALYVIIARAYVNKGDYLSALEIVNENIEPGFIDQLISDGILIKALNTESVPIVGAQTNVSSEATLRLTKTKNEAEVPIELVKVLAVKSADESVQYQIIRFDQGGSDIIFKGNPIPQDEDTFKVDLIYASDFGLFLSKLYEKLASFRNIL